MNEVLEKARGMGAEATLITGESRRTDVSFDFNRLKNIEDTETYSMSIQILKDGRLGVSTSTKVGGEQELLEKALNVTRFGSPASYAFPSPETPPNPKIFYPEVENLRIEEMIALGEELVSFVKTLDPAINGSAGVSRNITRKTISNTRGLSASWQKTSFFISASFQFVEGQNLLQSWDWDASCTLKYDLDRMKEKLREDFELGRRNVPVEPGLYDVLFTPAGFSGIIHPVHACLDGRAVMRGVSPLKDRIGEEIFARTFSVVEDGTLDDGLGSQLYDDQGVACSRTPLIEKGVLREYLLDLESSTRLGRKPTGTGTPSGARPNNLLVLPGETPWEEILKGMKRGIVIDQTMGSWAGNPYTGTVTGNIALGFLVVDGKKVGRVKDCMFSLNVFTHFRTNLLALSRETKNTGQLILPYCLVGGVSIATRTA